MAKKNHMLDKFCHIMAKANVIEINGLQAGHWHIAEESEVEEDLAFEAGCSNDLQDFEVIIPASAFNKASFSIKDGTFTVGDSNGETVQIQAFRKTPIKA